MNVPRARCIAGRLAHAIGTQTHSHQDALFVLGGSFAVATPWKLSVLILLLILTLKRMVSVLLK